jgi:hypothetical protein
MTTTQTVKSLALANTRDLLSGVAGFATMTPTDQRSLFRQVYNAQCAELDQMGGRGRSAIASNGESTARALADPRKASDMIDDKRHLNKRIEQAGQLAGEFIDEIDFPKFVRDLVKGVFDANLEVTVKQMEAFQALLKTATRELTSFINKIDDTATFGYLVESQPDMFSMDFPDDGETDRAGNPKPVLTDKGGAKLDLGDNEVKARIMEAKIAMAKEQRALLREVILMGVTRLVVEKGVIKASCLFDIKASEKVDKADKAALQSAVSDSTSITASGGLIGSIFGGPTAGHTRSSQKSKISVSSAKSQATTDLAAKVAGSVEIQFKTDYFKLDNFATMYGPVTGGPPPAVPGQAAPVAPARP